MRHTNNKGYTRSEHYLVLAVIILLSILLLPLVLGTYIVFLNNIFVVEKYYGKFFVYLYIFILFPAVIYMEVKLFDILTDYIATPSLFRQYLLDGVSLRFHIKIMKMKKLFDEHIYSHINSFLLKKKIYKIKKLKKLEIWSRMGTHSEEIPLPASLFDDIEE